MIRFPKVHVNDEVDKVATELQMAPQETGDSKVDMRAKTEKYVAIINCEHTKLTCTAYAVLYDLLVDCRRTEVVRPVTTSS